MHSKKHNLYTTQYGKLNLRTLFISAASCSVLALPSLLSGYRFQGRTIRRSLVWSFPARLVVAGGIVRRSSQIRALQL